MTGAVATEGRAVFVAVAAAVLASIAVVAMRVEFTPEVESDFFFATDDPQLAASRRIGERFPAGGEQVLVTAAAEDIFAPGYLERVETLSAELSALDGVTGVRSLTRGPSSPEDANESPLWRRLLLGSDPRTSQLVVSVEPGAGAPLVAALEDVIARHHAPSFALEVSGVPVVVELIRRQLARDLRRFSAVALVVFGLLVAAIYRSRRIVAGTLAACLGACALTLAVLELAGAPFGLLTANIVTIVFVLTLSHIVFLTANWRRARAAGEDGAAATASALRLTFSASFWSMTTTLLGFSSLRLASAQPLRELGTAGAVGAAAAIVVAYGLYPVFLRGARGLAEKIPPSPPFSKGGTGLSKRGTGVSSGNGFPNPGWAGVGAAAVLVAVAAFGVPKLDTDPGLLSYFAAGSEIRTGLETVDRSGGSSPLDLVVRDPAGEPLDTRENQDRLRRLQEAIDRDPAVGTSLSLPVLVAEARRNPLAMFLNDGQIIDVLDTPLYQNIARGFVTEDRKLARFFLRMRETGRDEPRADVIARLAAQVPASGLELELKGGLYELQDQLGKLVSSSLLSGLGGLLTLFVVVAVIVARMPRIAVAMVVSLAAVPVLLLGTLGHLRIPLDIISSPAASIAIALGVDSMIHLVTAVRRRLSSGDPVADAWARATARLWRPIAGATSILAIGFGIFALSSFPPTQRFGLAVALGTLIAAAIALFVLPVLAGRR